MATTPQVIDQEPDLPQSQQTQDETPETADLGEWNELLSTELQEVLKNLARQAADEFKYPRRLQVMQSWRARSFWREMQHLSWNWEDEAWDVLGPAGAHTSGVNNQLDTAVLYSTNIYQGFGDAFIAIITQSVPSVRFEPEDPEEAADMETASAAESFRKLIQHENDPIKMMTKAAYYAWTDGLLCGWTRWEVDKRTGQPREMQTIYGAMEVKTPIIYEDECEMPYLQFSNEYHLSTVRDKVKKRTKFPLDYWKKIKGGSSGNGQDIYERTARISIKQGIAMKSAGGDAYGTLVTTQRTWFRPSVFLDDKVEDKYRDELTALFPSGCYVEFDNAVYTGSRDATMDDEWVIENVMEGDGSFRNAKGTCLVGVQERFNDIVNCTQDVYEKTQPASHWDDKLFDVDAMKRQRSAPGERKGVNLEDMPAGDLIANHVFFEPAATVSPDMLQYGKSLMSDIPEFLTGISSILFGADETSDKSGKALSIQQAAAMGRVGLPFRVMKRFYARMMEQAVRCAARNRKSDWRMGIPDENGQIETVAVRVGDLSGNIRCYPNSDENYPESWMSKRATYMQLLQEGNSDPTMKAILSNPENQNLAKRLIGLDEMTIPDAASWRKQMVEINLMLEEVPTPPQPQPPQQVPNPLAPHIMETIQPPPLPPQSSIPIDPDWDNNAAELLTVSIFLNSLKGQKLKQTKPLGIANIKLHGLAHKQALMASMPPPAPPVPAVAPKASHHAGAPPAGAPPTAAPAGGPV